ncbi:MAG: hypothetical protein MK096_07635 [Oleiphilaceae bacterium]|nr:hypothetical protein [Oleiphilaceae bacterium]
MLKKTLLSAAVASSFALSGCLDDSPSTTENAGSVTNPPVANGVFPIFSPSEAKFPVPNDLLYSSETAGDGTFVDLGVPNPLPPYSASEYNPVTAALGGLSGASTVAPIDIAMSGLIDPASLKGQSDGAEQNVFLIALEYESGDPLQGLSVGEPPALAAKQPTFDLEHKVLDGNSYIRINPKGSVDQSGPTVKATDPLEPLTRYLVVVKNTIIDMNGDPIVQSPGAAGYAALTDSSNPLTGSLAALQPVQTLINGLWETIALQLPTINSDSEIALSYSFTTSGDEKVLNYIADPQQWFTDQVNRFIGITAVKATTGYVSLNDDGTIAEDYRKDDGTGNPGKDYNPTLFAIGDQNMNDQIDPGEVSSTQIATAVATATTPFPQTLAPASWTALTTLTNSLFPAIGGSCSGLTPPAQPTLWASGPAYIACLGKALANPLSPTGAVLPTPTASTFTPVGSTTALSASSSVTQGTIDIPYYSRTPDATFGSLPIKYLSWEADTTVAAAINNTFAALGLALPQGIDSATGNIIDPMDATQTPVSTAVNYIFPFPKKQADQTIPVAIVHPTSFTGPMKTMILGHGLGGSRSIALSSPGKTLVETAAAAPINTDIAVVAIDQPLHGLTAFNDVDGVLEKTAYERHFEFGYSSSGAAPSDLETTAAAAVAAGTFPSEAAAVQQLLALNFLNVESFLTTRDNNRQNALDLLTLRKTIPSIDIDGGGADLDGTDVHYQGYSLGTISAQAFVAVANDLNQTDSDNNPITTDDISTAFFSTPGGGIARFIESSPAFAGNIVDGLASQGVTSDTSNYQAFLNTAQASFDAFDAINFVGDYSSQPANILYWSASNDQVIPVSQIPVSDTDNRPLTSAAGVLGASEINASKSFLSGAEPLFAVSGATAVPTGAGQAITQNFIRWAPGFGSHGGPCPATDSTPDDPNTGNEGALEFGGFALGMLTTQTVSNSGVFVDDGDIEEFFIDSTGCSATP